MENYPNIQRRDGTLFFACPEFDKGAIATSIERLIDMLDAMEDDPDLEPYLAGYANEGGDDRETDLDINEGDDNPDDEDGADDEPSIGVSYYAGYGVIEPDLEGDEADSEPSLGWTAAVDQTSPVRFGNNSVPDIEENGDEQDCSFNEDEWSPYVPGRLHFSRGGSEIVDEMIRGLPIAAKRAAYAVMGSGA